MKRTLFLSSILFGLTIIVPMNVLAQKDETAVSTVNPEESEGLGINSVDEAQKVVSEPIEKAVNAGDSIRGIVRDSNGPMMHVNVVEIDKNDKVQAFSVSDYNGNFSFRAVDPKNNKIRFTFVGYETQSLPFDAKYFDIEMKDNHKILNLNIVMKDNSRILNKVSVE